MGKTSQIQSEVEFWRDVVGYEGLYRVSSFGNVFGAAVDRLLKHTTSGRYPVVSLRKDGVKEVVLVHRLVATAFIPNPENKPTVNHKDGDTKNFLLSNLEWATMSYQMEHARKVLGFDNSRHLRKSVRCLSKDGTLVKEYESISEASRQSGLGFCGIHNCLKRHTKSSGGYVWRYVDEVL